MDEALARVHSCVNLFLLFCSAGCSLVINCTSASAHHQANTLGSRNKDENEIHCKKSLFLQTSYVFTLCALLETYYKHQLRLRTTMGHKRPFPTVYASASSWVHLNLTNVPPRVRHSLARKVEVKFFKIVLVTLQILLVNIILSLIHTVELFSSSILSLLTEPIQFWSSAFFQLSCMKDIREVDG